MARNPPAAGALFCGALAAAIIALLVFSFASAATSADDAEAGAAADAPWVGVADTIDVGTLADTYNSQRQSFPQWLLLAVEDSRIMVDGATKAFTQAFNVEIAVDGDAQIIVARDVTQRANDKRELVPMAEQVRENMGRLPDNLSADSGFFSAEAVTDPRLADTNLLIPPDRQKHGGDSSAEGAGPPADPPTATASVADQMRDKLRNEAGRQLYKQRKAIVEPVFGQIKEARGFRRFLLRGLQNVRCEFDLIALTHNLLKLFRSGWSPSTAAAAAPASLT